jgi:hypothetical protein
MKIFNALRAVFRGGTTGFNALEKKILNTVMSQLDAGSAEKLRRRIDQVNLVQRHDGGREVNCYQMMNGKPAFDQSTRLTNTQDEQVFAEFSFTSMGDASFVGKMWLVNGVFFSLEFDNPTEHAIDDEVKSLRVELVSSEAI